MAGFSILQEATIPFNGGGVFSLAEPAFVPGTVIVSADMNSDLSDIADGLSTCLTNDGQSTMTGQLKGFAGSAAAPGYAFSSDLDTGFYRKGANNIGGAVAGAEVLDISATGLDVTGAVTENGDQIIPAGSVFPYAGSSAPTGFLLCFGQSLLRTDYAALFTAIGTTYGAADGTHFSIPDLRGRSPFGKDDMGGSAANRITTAGSSIDGTTLGAVGGAQNVTLAQANLPNVTLALTGNATISGQLGMRSGASAVDVGGTGINVVPFTEMQSITAALSSGATASINGGVTQTATNKMPGAMILNSIIKT